MPRPAASRGLADDLLVSAATATVAWLLFRFLTCAPVLKAHKPAAATEAAAAAPSADAVVTATSTKVTATASPLPVSASALPASSASRGQYQPASHFTTLYPSTSADVSRVVNVSASADGFSAASVLPASLPSFPPTAPSAEHRKQQQEAEAETKQPLSPSSSGSPSTLVSPALVAEASRARPARVAVAPLSSGLSRAALLVAAARAQESRLPSETRLFSDPFAEALSSSFGHEMLAEVALAAGLTSAAFATSVAIRSRFFDDALLAAVSQGLSANPTYVSPSKVVGSSRERGDVITQVLVLGCGSDTRALRLPLPDWVTVWEVDAEETLLYREEVISREIRALGGEERMPSKARVLPVAFDLAAFAPPPARSAADLTALLRASAFDASLPSVVVCEGALMFLRDSAVRHLIATVTALCPAQSVLLCDLVNSQFLKQPASLPLLAAWERWSTRPVSGYDLPEAVFASAGWSAKVLQEGQEWETSYGRVDEQSKRLRLRQQLRGGANDVSRVWIIAAKRI